MSNNRRSVSIIANGSKFSNLGHGYSSVTDSVKVLISYQTTEILATGAKYTISPSPTTYMYIETQIPGKARLQCMELFNKICAVALWSNPAV